MYPFELSAYIAEGSRYFVPIQELCEKLGADIKWSDGKKAAIINYQGRTVEISTEKDTYISFGDCHPYKTIATIQNGKLMVDNGTLLYGLNVWIEEPNSETGELLPPDCTWVIIP